MAKSEQNPNEMTYEQAFSELDAIVKAMESEQKPLDEAMKLFERGQMLAKRCTDLLDKAELCIKELSAGKNSAE